MSPHQHFEELSALALSGDIREDEWTELCQHLESCASCRKTASGLEQAWMLLMEAAVADDSIPVPKGMSGRFIARARSSGIPLNARMSECDDSRSSTRGWNWASKVLLCASAVVLVVVSLLLGVRIGGRHVGSSTTTPSQSKDSGSANINQLSSEYQQLRDRVSRLQEQATTVSAKLKQQQLALEAANREKSELTARIADLEGSNAKLSGRESQHLDEIAQLKQRSDQLVSQQLTRRAEYLASEAELRNLREQVSMLGSQLREAEKLTTALSDTRELIRSRNLHVMNIPSVVDERGRPRGPFGRIFYAEGERLDFYAFDLSDPDKLTAKASFYVWGEKTDALQRIVNLGKLQIDSKKDGRWLLSVTDPHLLAHVKSVFVTLERNDTSIAEPTGKPLLSRVLNTAPDHP